MPAVFHRIEGEWRLARVAASPSVLRLNPVSVEPADTAGVQSAKNASVLLHVVGPKKWAALVGSGVALLHNGVPVATGLRILEHRDALALAGCGTLFFTTEELAQVETFAAAEPVACPRCRSEVRQGDAVVRCPACGMVHHESETRNCWTYAETCTLCPQPTALDAGLRWTPEEM